MEAEIGKIAVKLLRSVKCSSWIVVSETFDVALTEQIIERNGFFPCTSVLTAKDLFSEVITKVKGTKI